MINKGNYLAIGFEPGKRSKLELTPEKLFFFVNCVPQHAMMQCALFVVCPEEGHNEKLPEKGHEELMCRIIYPETEHKRL